MSRSEDKMIRTFGALVVGLIAGSGIMWLSFRDEIKFAEKFSLLKSCDDFLAERQAELTDNAYGESLINGYISGLDKFSYYKGGVSREIEDNIDSLNRLPTALGSGFTIDVNSDGMLYFEEVAPGMPADKQGICEGDVVLSVNGESIDVKERRSVNSIAGKDGTSCKLILLRGNETVEVDFVRSNSDEKKWNNVSYEMHGDTLYIKISSFWVFEPLSALETEEYSSVVLDVRDNAGGDTGYVLSYAASFVADGYVKFHSFNGEGDTMSVEGGRRLGVPVVVLVNEGTASAAEIITSLLKQYGDATIVGTNTYGKGTFQLNEALGDGILHYTDGYFTAGRWDCWDGVGIAPDVEVQMDSARIGTAEDVQLEKALEILGNMH